MWVGGRGGGGGEVKQVFVEDSSCGEHPCPHTHRMPVRLGNADHIDIPNKRGAYSVHKGDRMDLYS